MDFKIASKTIAKRMESVLPHLIHSDQTGFIKGRYIGDLLEQTKIDFCKAFDTTECSSLHRVLELHNVGKTFRRWIQLFTEA